MFQMLEIKPYKMTIGPNNFFTFPPQYLCARVFSAWAAQFYGSVEMSPGSLHGLLFLSIIRIVTYAHTIQDDACGNLWNNCETNTHLWSSRVDSPSWLRGSDWKHWTNRTVVTVVVWAVVACKCFSGSHLATVEAENEPNEKKNSV